MANKTYIIDPQSGLKTEVKYYEDCLCNALTVATMPRVKYNNRIKYFTNELYGSELAQNTSGSGGSIEKIHNGIDDILWTASRISGTPSDFNFASTDQAHTGAASINCTAAEGGDIFQLTDVTEHSVTDYNILTGWVYVTSNWNSPADGLSIVLYNTNSGTQVSNNSISLNNYINGSSVRVWQKFTIEIDDFGISTDFNALRCTILSDGSHPNFYLDDIQLEQTEDVGALNYSLEASKSTWLHVKSLNFFISDEYSPILTDSTMPKIPYNSILGVTAIDSGISFRYTKEYIIDESFSIKQLSDLISLPGTTLYSYGSDGTNTWLSIKMEFCEPLILKEEFRDKMEFIISDDLSGLLSLKISASCMEEKREI